MHQSENLKVDGLACLVTCWICSFFGRCSSFLALICIVAVHALSSRVVQLIEQT